MGTKVPNPAPKGPKPEASPAPPPKNGRYEMPSSNCLVYVRKFFGGSSSLLKENWFYNGYINPDTQSMWVFNEFNELMRLLDEDSFEVYPGA